MEIICALWLYSVNNPTNSLSWSACDSTFPLVSQCQSVAFPQSVRQQKYITKKKVGRKFLEKNISEYFQNSSLALVRSSGVATAAGLKSLRLPHAPVHTRAIRSMHQSDATIAVFASGGFRCIRLKCMYAHAFSMPKFATPRFTVSLCAGVSNADAYCVV